MKNKLIFLLAVAIFSITVCAGTPHIEKQETDVGTLETTYKNNKVISDKEYTDDGELTYEAEYNKDESVSKQTFYLADGQKETVVYERDKIGYVTSEIHYDSDGIETLRYEMEYNPNYTVNKYITYENNEIISEIYMEYNSEWIPTTAKEYDINDSLIRYIEYKYTENFGLLSETAYRADGTLEYKYEFNEETMITIYSEYDDNGKLINIKSLAMDEQELRL